MYNPQLETFIHVADAGSFNKAATESHLTPTAVIKQINSLENSLNLQLFNRTHHGVVLTKAGASLYEDAKFIVEYSRNAILKARQAMDDENKVIRIGTSIMTPAQLLMDLWPQIHKHCSDLSFELISFENTPENARDILHNLGDKIDVVAGIFDETLLKLRGCSGFELCREPICCAVSIHHPLAEKERLRIEDLFGEDLMVIKRDWSEYMDEIRDDLTQNYPQIKIEDFPFYDIGVFNQCEQQRKVMLVIGKWNNIHPMLKVIPVEWDYSIPFGILHAPEPTKTAKRFLSAVREVIAENEL